MEKNNIILIGFMGVGKGTVARAINLLDNSFCIDTDDLIESLQKSSIKNIFSKHGEEHFRQLEKDCAQWLEKSVINTVISTGGGFYKQANLSKIGTIVYLHSSFDGILNRINSSTNAKKKLDKRPLLKNIQEAKKLFNLRKPQYENVSDIVVDVENKESKDIALEIFAKVGRKI